MIPEDAEEFLEEIEEEIEEGKWKKIVIYSTGVIVLVIFLVYVFIHTVGGDILGGLISSSKVEGEEVDFSFDGKLVFENESLERLKGIYFKNQKVEIKVCLKGKKEDKKYFIKDVYVPRIYSQGFNQVVAEGCSEDSLVSLHSHPYKHCLASEQDFRSFKKFKEKNEDALMVVMCEDKRFGVYQ